MPYPFGEVMLDTCPSHGTWFDHDEIARVVRAARKMKRADPDAISMPSGSDVWATAKFAAGMVAMPFQFLGHILAFYDADRERRRREGYDVWDD